MAVIAAVTEVRIPGRVCHQLCGFASSPITTARFYLLAANSALAAAKLHYKLIKDNLTEIVIHDDRRYFKVVYLVVPQDLQAHRFAWPMAVDRVVERLALVDLRTVGT